ncbi:MAG: hypothetical protein GX862_09410 [Leucobacter sp.]|nr:hypothetical protein [Leucobacter sp.]
MTSGVFGGGVIFVVAALLWAAVLVPSFIRRKEFKAAEQNALRLQRTLRVLAETAEVPSEVRVEATAREALAQERLLRTAQRRQEAERKAQLSEARAAQVRAEMRAQQVKRKQAALVRSAKLRRPWVRRVRQVAAIAFVLACIGAVTGGALAMFGSPAVLLLGSLAVAAAGLGALVLLAPGRVKHVDIDAEHVIEEVPAAPAVTAQEEREEDRAAAAHAAAQAAAAARIERARARARARAAGPTKKPQAQNKPHSILLDMAAADEAPAQPTTAVAQPVAPASPSTTSHAAADAGAASFSRMGIIGDTSDGALDLDEVLRSRRKAG